MKIFTIFILVFGFNTISIAQDLVYKPINPAFGGDTFNYSWLLNSAESQNKYREPDNNSSNLTALQLFKNNLNNQLLSQVSNSLFQKQFGDKGVVPGSYTFGSLAVNIYPSNLGLVVDILDTDTGEKTQVFIPGG
ncbi:curli production assembly/transport component CsgF [Flavobacterium granuli]|uniref:Curli production assembly/transport component CsgF n=1 Tax=Flavobacterium granuli TaxID=280093 RepID=A0A1M5RSW7_9FLAO|nr:curli production assembly/transport component CsgF [Flavobacterium granuli]PRZ22758.1 curli production assembly/transport component CsgF [Flavobacterium granuli]SHH29384.1 curli production assembly/transport component CsgF [Flavobacterium granuli]